MLKNEKIKLAIAGYGNLGRGVELAVLESSDMRLTNIFTRREPKSVVPLLKGTEVLAAAALEDENPSFEPPDVLLVCGGSAQDLPWQSPKYARRYNIVDSFDNHAKMYEHFVKLDEAARAGGKAAIIAAGWDPGLFSLCRAMGETLMPQGKSATFWGRGISQGHSDALRRIDGVIDARQYTIPKMEIMEAFRQGEEEIGGEIAVSQAELCAKRLESQKDDARDYSDFASGKDRHRRECFVVAKSAADREKIREEIIHMPDYFEGYDTTVNFVSMEELRKEHSKMPHGGTVIRVGHTGMAAICPCEALVTESSDSTAADCGSVGTANAERANTGTVKECKGGANCAAREFEGNKAAIELSLTLDSNPEFTAEVMLAYARAAYRLSQAGETGARTVFDIPQALLSQLSREEMIKRYL